jgi:CBS domain containing-hemolysin-like protein
MVEDWVSWLALALATFVYGIMTLTLSVLQPQGLAAMLGMASTESSDLNPGSAGDYRATRIVVTTIRSASFIAIVISGYRAAQTTFTPGNEALLMSAVAAAVLIGVIAMRMVLNRMASGCYEEVKIWLAPVIWPSRFIGRRLRLNRVVNYMNDVENQGDASDEPVENVLNVLQNLSSKDLRADDLMVPISDTVAVHADTALEDVVEMMDQLSIYNVVVYDKTLDEVLGTIHKAEALQGLRQSDGGSPICRDWISASIFPVPVTHQVATLFDDFRDRMHETAVMLDEEGKVAGVLTFSVLMEQLLRDASLVAHEVQEA